MMYAVAFMVGFGLAFGILVTAFIKASWDLWK